MARLSTRSEGQFKCRHLSLCLLTSIGLLANIGCGAQLLRRLLVLRLARLSTMHSSTMARTALSTNRESCQPPIVSPSLTIPALAPIGMQQRENDFRFLESLFEHFDSLSSSTGEILIIRID